MPPVGSGRNKDSPGGSPYGDQFGYGDDVDASPRVQELERQVQDLKDDKERMGEEIAELTEMVKQSGKSGRSGSDSEKAQTRKRGRSVQSQDDAPAAEIQKGMQVKFKEFTHSDWNEGTVVDFRGDMIRVKYSDEGGRSWQMRIPNRPDRVEALSPPPSRPARKRRRAEQSHGSSGEEPVTADTVTNLRKENRDLRRQLDAEKIRAALRKKMNPRERRTLCVENPNAPRGKKCIIPGAYVEVFSEQFQKWLVARVQSIDDGEVVVVYTRDVNSTELQTKAVDIRSSYIKPLSPERAQEWAEYLALFQSAPPSEMDEILEVDKVIRLFRHFDMDGDNFLSYSEFKALLQATEDDTLNISEDKFYEFTQYDQGMTVEELRKVYEESPDANIDRDFYTVFQQTEGDDDDNYFGLTEEELRDKAITLDKKFKKLTRDHAAVVQKLNAMTALDRTLKENQKAAAVMNLQEELQHITKVKDSLQRALMEQNPEKVAELERVFGQLNDQRVARLKSRIDVLAEENDEMHDSAIRGGKAKGDQMQKLRYQVEESNIELEKHKQLSDSLIAEQGRLKKELNQEQDQHESTMQGMAVEKEKVYRLEQEQQGLMSDAEELVEVRESRRKLDARCKELKFELEDMQEQLDNAQARAREFDILKGQVDEIMTEKDEAYGRNLQEVIEERERHKEKHEHLMTQIEELSAQFEEARVAPDQLRRSQEELRRQLGDKEKEVSMGKIQSSKYKSHNEELQRELDRIREEVRRGRSENSRYKTDCGELETKLKNSQERAAESTADSQGKARQLKQQRLQLIALHHENKDVQSLRQNIDYLQGELNKVLEEAPGMRRKLEEQIRSLQLSIKQKEEEAAIFGRVEIRKLKGKLDAAQVENQDLDRANLEEKQRGGMMLEQLKKLRAKTADLEATLDATREDADQRVEDIEDKLTEDLQQTRFAVGDLRNALDMERQANKHLQNQAEDDRAKIEILTNRLNNSLNKMQQLTAAVQGSQAPATAGAYTTPGGLDSASRVNRLTQHAQNFMSSLQTEVKSEFQTYQSQNRDAAREAFNNMQGGRSEYDRASPLSASGPSRTYLGQTKAATDRTDWSKVVKTY